MTDKVQRIREEVEKLKSQLIRGVCASQLAMQTRCKEEAYNEVLAMLDTMQEESVSKKFAFKAIPRLLEMIEPTDRAKAYIAKLADTLEVEGYSTDAKIVRVSLKIMNGEKVPMATMDKETVSEDLGEYINELSKRFPEVSFAKLSRIAVRVAKWQKEQLMTNTADAMIGLPYENKDGGYTHLVDVSRPLPVGNNKIAIIFKED